MSEQHMTEATEIKRALVIGAHPDDNEFGAGGTTAKLAAQGWDVTFIIVTNGNKGSHDPGISPYQLSEMREQEQRAAAAALGVKRAIFLRNNDGEIESALTGAAALGPGALLVSADSFFTSRRKQIVALAARLALPACYPWPQYVEDGGLVSYGTDLNWAFDQIGNYAARILKGAVPNDLPVQLPVSFRTSINLKTANALNLTIPPLVLVGADRVIE